MYSGCTTVEWQAIRLFWPTIWGMADMFFLWVSDEDCLSVLGKTVTTAAVICTNRTVQSGMCPTTLVIAPNIGILQHWLAELKRFAPKLDVLLYHGQGKRQDPGLPDVTLLTLSELRNQYTAYRDENVVDQQNFPLYTKKWHRIVIVSAKASWALKKSHALCLTGTPAQNSLRDLFPLLKFIDVKTQGLNNRASFDTLVTNPYCYIHATSQSLPSTFRSLR
ncbi:SNF2 family N-terminal domain-containing protein [Mycena maculata]|uniref:SNF2 family N-terminal domain-containing protein n=1 Tax=Mycena maculata TaxID=230809 RepID=A0AAD7NAS8_9AGAR|nr:SNF2 family N-terminal domain-containing protein [Mycena maculata]